MTIIQRSSARRKFIKDATGAGLAMMFAPFFSSAMQELDPRVAKIVAQTMGIDTHNHMDVPFDPASFSNLAYDLPGEMKKSGLRAICMTFQVDRPSITKSGDGYRRFNTSLDEMDIMLKTAGIKRALNIADIKKAQAENQPIVIQSVEGAHFVEGQLDRIGVAYERGLRHLGLMHDNQAAQPLGDIYTDKPQYGGLTEYGLNIVKECNRQGILVDLTHCSNDAVNAALKVSTRPVILSHTGLDTRPGSNERMAQMMKPRLISKEQAKIIAGAGGVIGVWTHLAETPLEYAQNIRAMVDVIGIDHVCIGTDTKMAPPFGGNDRNGQKTNEAWQDQGAGFYYVVVNALLQTGFNEAGIGKIAGGNYCRIFEMATKK
jgi:membrane dipeptidase